jgi:hypothetical protein
MGRGDRRLGLFLCRWGGHPLARARIEDLRGLGQISHEGPIRGGIADKGGRVGGEALPRLLARVITGRGGQPEAELRADLRFDGEAHVRALDPGGERTGPAFLATGT